jgi:hypothetical protein
MREDESGSEERREGVEEMIMEERSRGLYRGGEMRGGNYTKRE